MIVIIVATLTSAIIYPTASGFSCGNITSNGVLPKPKDAPCDARRILL